MSERERFAGAQRRRCLAVLGGFACLLAQGRVGPAAAARRADEAQQAPALGARVGLPAVTLLDGRELAASHWQGKVVVVELWASWCPFCARQNPHLDALHRRHRDQGLEVLGLSIDHDPEAARRYMAERGYVFHAAMFDDAWRAAIGRPRGLPVTWVFDRGARLVRLEIGELFPEDIEEFAQYL